jgi:hypothetical protein
MLFILLFSTLALGVQAIDIEAGFLYGMRTVADSQIKKVYGNGSCMFPFVGANIWRGLGLVIGYETGYSRDGKIGLYGEPTTLKVGGFIVSLVYQHRLGLVAPYLGLGYGSFSYKQTIDSPYAFEKVDATQGGLVISAGIKVYPLKNVFICGDFKYIPLKVKPFEETVDLGGMRLSLGLGASFGL